MEDIEALLPAGSVMSAKDTLELINVFAGTWFSINDFDAENLFFSNFMRNLVCIG